MKNYFLVLILLLGSYSFVYSQETDENKSSFSIASQLRTRGEYRNGALFPRDEGVKPAIFINNRARLTFNYSTNRLILGISAQHVGVWGQDAMINKNGNFILNQAWAKFMVTDNFFVQLGRQSLSYDDERILGGLDWNVAGRYHDALKLGYGKNNHKVEAVLAFNQNDEKIIGGTYYDNSLTKFYKTMQTLWYHYQFKTGIPFGVSLLAMNLGYDYGDASTKQSDTKYMQTFGTHITLKPNRFDLSGTIYGQTGKNKTSSIAAYMFGIKGVFYANSKWSINLGSDYLSGNDGKSDKFKAFDPLFGTHHKFYGSMDYFYASAFNAGFAPGLWDTYLGTSYNVNKDLKMSLNYHYFNTAVKLTDLKRNIGSEIDYQLDWKVMKNVSISAGYSVMFGTETMNAIKGGNHKCWQDWGWISININPTIFSKK